MKENWSSVLFQSRNVISLWMCRSSDRAGERITPWTGRRSIKGHTVEFCTESQREVSHFNAPQHARCRAAHLHSHFDSSGLWWPSMARMQNCGSDGCKGWPLDYVTTLSNHRVLKMHLIRLLYPNEIVQGLAFVPLSPRSHLWSTWCFASD